jgi:hypothetical protein
VRIERARENLFHGHGDRSGVLTDIEDGDVGDTLRGDEG